jgi:hypothetical protein
MKEFDPNRHDKPMPVINTPNFDSPTNQFGHVPSYLDPKGVPSPLRGPSFQPTQTQSTQAQPSRYTNLLRHLRTYDQRENEGDPSVRGFLADRAAAGMEYVSSGEAGPVDTPIDIASGITESFGKGARVIQNYEDAPNIVRAGARVVAEANEGLTDVMRNAGDTAVGRGFARANDAVGAFADEGSADAKKPAAGFSLMRNRPYNELGFVPPYLDPQGAPSPLRSDPAAVGAAGSAARATAFTKQDVVGTKKVNGKVYQELADGSLFMDPATVDADRLGPLNEDGTGNTGVIGYPGGRVGGLRPFGSTTDFSSTVTGQRGSGLSLPNEGVHIGNGQYVQRPANEISRSHPARSARAGGNGFRITRTNPFQGASAAAIAPFAAQRLQAAASGGNVLRSIDRIHRRADKVHADMLAAGKSVRAADNAARGIRAQAADLVGTDRNNAIRQGDALQAQSYDRRTASETQARMLAAQQGASEQNIETINEMLTNSASIVDPKSGKRITDPGLYNRVASLFGVGNLYSMNPNDVSRALPRIAQFAQFARNYESVTGEAFTDLSLMGSQREWDDIDWKDVWTGRLGLGDKIAEIFDVFTDNNVQYVNIPRHGKVRLDELMNDVTLSGGETDAWLGLRRK